MWTMRTGGWARVAALVMASGCASGESTDSGAPTATLPPVGTDTTGADLTTGADDSSSTTAPPPTTDDPTTGTTTTTDLPDDSSSTGGVAVCGDGVVGGDEECDDGNQVDTDECLKTCVAAACGDGVVQAGVEACEDGNQIDGDACTNACKVATCGDGVVYTGVEVCDDGVNDGAYGGCGVGCSKLGPRCGDGTVDAGPGETCDDGNAVAGDGCDGECKSELTCTNVGGGPLEAENGTGMGVFYCYDPADSVDVRARKACESHWGVGACCVIGTGYSGLQWGKCDGGGGEGTVHFHPDAHPEGHCAPVYQVGDVLAPGFCGVILGNFLD